ncbi:MAG TPA: FdhF/YdeP family oxidoreductase [Polyangiaceae bacterium]|jgi:molybdopterin-dependent oxidoreductase alpha subunit|nr:FdhF/YdeP family oxidoreductase [Polyangiaceae bacterium]
MDAERDDEQDPSLAEGVPGAEPPIEVHPAERRRRNQSAAGFTSIYETVRHGFAEMGVGRTVHTLLRVNQKGGFDCPSCAWPDPDGDRKMAEFCENGAKAITSEAMRKRIGAEFFAEHGVSSLLERSDLWLEKQGRLTQPMFRDSGSDHYVPIEWDDAFALVGSELNGLASPDEAAFYTSGRASNEAAFLYGLFARQLGTNNLPDCSNMCHESSGTGLTESIGIGKATVKIEDFAHADAIFVIGQNPGTNHPRMLTELQKAVRNGCKIVSVNPLPETGLMRFKNPQEPLSLLGPGTQLACLFLPVKVNGDVALLKGLMKEMLEEDRKSGGKVLAHDFIEQQTEGFDAFAADLDAEPWERIVESSGVSRELIREGAEIAMRAEHMICSWAMGITQHKNGVANVQSIANFALMRGQIGRRGAGLCPVRGHSNVQGDRTMGIWEKMSDEFLDALGKEFSFAPPREHGLDAVKTIRAMHAGQVKVFVALGGNFLSATPDTHFTSEAIQRCELTVQVSTKLNRGHLITGKRALILPCLGRTERDVQKGGEQFVTVEDTTGVVHSSQGALPPASEHLRSECAIVAGLAAKTLAGRTKVDWHALVEDYDRVREHIEHVVPGFAQYNRRVRDPGGFYLPNGPREGKFTTPSGRARLTVHPLPEHTLESGELMLTTIRSHDQFNTTIYGETDRYRGIKHGRRVVFLNPDDIGERGLAEGSFVDLVSRFGKERRRAPRFEVVSYPIARGCAAAYFPETNVLVPVGSVADRSNQPASKSVVIRLEPSALPARHPRP